MKFGPSGRLDILVNMASKKTAGRTKKWLAIVILFSPAFLLVLIGSRSCEHKFMELDDYGRASDYSFTSITNESFNQDNLEGSILIVNLIKPGCPTECNLSFWHLDKDIYQRIRKNRKKLGKVRLLSIAVDANGNEVDDLKPFADMINDHVEDYDPGVWMLTKGDKDQLYDFSKNDKLRAEVDKYFKNSDVTSLILLIDDKNHYRMVMNGTTESNIRTLKQYMALLQKENDKESSKKN